MGILKKGQVRQELDRLSAKFEEMRYLEKSIGKTGCLAMSPFLQMTRKDLWQLYVLDEKA